MQNNSKIGLGTVQFGLSYGISNKKGQTTENEVKKLLNFANLNGIEVLDSASAYGTAEEVLGKNHLNSFKIVSKFMPPVAGEKISLQLEQSLRKLKITNLYGYLAHRPLELLEFPEQWEELKSFKTQGKVEKIGFSLNEPGDLELLLDAGLIPDLVQVPYSYFDRRFEQLIKQLKSKGCEIHTRSTFLQGLFFIKPGDLDRFFDEVKPLLIELQKGNDSLPGRLLNFVIEQAFIDKVIIGVENLQQLKQNLNHIGSSFSLPLLEQEISNNILTPSFWPKQ